MVCCLASTDECDEARYGEGWEGVTVIGSPASDQVELSTAGVCAGAGGQFSGLAYLWLETPCSGEELCPLYSDDQFNIPVAPWKYQL